MTKSELVDAYIRGDVDRRHFVSKLTAMGVSATAAVAYAGSLVQNTAASPSRNSAGFVARAQDADEEYGTAITLASDEAGVEALLDAAAALQGPLAALDGFTAEDFAEIGLDGEDLELLLDIRAQHQEHVEALSALIGAPAPGAGGAAPDTPLADLLVTLAEAFNDFVAVLAAVIPALEDGETRQLVTTIGLVAARHAALVSAIAGIDPIPSTFEEVDTSVGS